MSDYEPLEESEDLSEEKGNESPSSHSCFEACAVADSEAEDLVSDSEVELADTVGDESAIRTRLDILLTCRKNRHQVASVKKNQKKRVLRQDQGGGIAKRTGELFDLIIRTINKKKKLTLYPLTVLDTLGFMEDGKKVVTENKLARESAVLAEAGKVVVRSTGRALRQTAVGLLAQQNENGRLNPTQVAEELGVSKSYVYKARKRVSEQGTELTMFTSSTKDASRGLKALCPTRRSPTNGECEDANCPHLHRCLSCNDGSEHAACACPNWDEGKMARYDTRRVQAARKLSRTSWHDSEKEATIEWMQRENPSRSGDTKTICWMVKNKDDFYHEEYRSLGGQLEIIRIALDIYGELSAQARSATRTSGKDRWLRNIATYLDAVSAGATNKLSVRQLGVSDAAAGDVATIETVSLLYM